MGQELILLYRKLIGCSIEFIADEIATTVKPVLSQSPTISYRIKSQDTLAKKMIKKKYFFFIVGFFFFCVFFFSSANEAYLVLKALTKSFRGFLDHDYIANPKTRPDKPHLDGKSLKLLQFIAYKNNVPFEIQITTFEWNESNELLHDEYHREKYPIIDHSD